MNLETDRIPKLLLNFSIPAMIAMLVNATYNTVDRIFVSKGVGDTAFSGLAFTAPLSLVVLALIMLIAVGSTSMLSLRLGEKNMEEAEKVLTNCFVLLLIVSVLVTLIGNVFLKPILLLLGSEPETLQYSERYMRIIFGGCTFQIMGLGMSHMMRASGKPRLFMIAQLIGAVLNIILDYIFIFIWHKGIKGAAVATVIAQAAGMLWTFFHFFRKNSLIKIRREYFKLSKNVVTNILGIGAAPFFTQISASVTQVVAYKALVNYSGDMAVAAMGAVTSLSLLVLMLIYGLNQGAQPIIGYNYGAQNYKRVKDTLKYSSVAATSICVIGLLAVQIYTRPLISLFANGEELFGLAMPALKIYLFAFPCIGFQLVVITFYQSVNKAKSALVLSMLRQFILLIPLYLILPLFFGLNGVWLSAPVADVLTFVITAAMLAHDVNKTSLLSPIQP